MTASHSFILLGGDPQGYTGFKENETMILERDKSLRGLWKYERVYF